ncbi:ribosomal RNA small subunit methyltransferase A [Candidatus Kaiserbacteria bacterium RIFCSPHIGHO2_01_FULL_49_13]|uniref:Ribosomal RNA small subunit methyltransferase A n=1 Tax=Candidatus Kaiserbacteria bacterium RIFCSPHIGHO2_01_FULL_49_13 TaxID=1798477 RepID=A0A1F6CEL9_9BACT|nr:MAG: ribosomal RNA small subunit methyltransferase A [Candidatus Kaiserbacteria bacterium RIFCSPHIGHO2_01_FULL_49_13]
MNYAIYRIVFIFMAKKTYLLKRKSLGQHFLTAPGIAARIAEIGTAGAADVVVEVGPGEGILTRELLTRAKRVIAIEKDDRLIPFLSEKFKNEIAQKKFSLVHGDVLKQHFVLPPNYCVVANIPYYITGALIRFFLEAPEPPKQMVLLVQREVAERIVAKKTKPFDSAEGKESLLSLSVKAYGTPAIAGVVKAGSFSPPPKVDSAILRISEISRAHFAEVPTNTFFQVLKTGFAHKRKLLIGNLSAMANKSALEKIFSEVTIPLKARAEDLPLEKWLKLAKMLAKIL